MQERKLWELDGLTDNVPEQMIINLGEGTSRNEQDYECECECECVCVYSWRFTTNQFFFCDSTLAVKILPFALYTSSLSVQALQSRSCVFTYLMLQWQLSHLNGHTYLLTYSWS
jgi:hypothetical protein